MAFVKQTANQRVLEEIKSDKPTYEELLARVQALQASQGGGRKPTFTKSDKNPNYWTFTHQLGTKGVYPWVGADKSAWRVILANVDMIKRALDSDK